MKIVSTTYLKNNVLQASSFLKRYQAVQALCNSDGGVFFLFFFGINMYCLRDTGVILGLHEVVHFRNTMVYIMKRRTLFWNRFIISLLLAMM